MAKKTKFFDNLVKDQNKKKQKVYGSTATKKSGGTSSSSSDNKSLYTNKVLSTANPVRVGSAVSSGDSAESGNFFERLANEVARKNNKQKVFGKSNSSANGSFSLDQSYLDNFTNNVNKYFSMPQDDADNNSLTWGNRKHKTSAAYQMRLSLAKQSKLVRKYYEANKYGMSVDDYKKAMRYLDSVDMKMSNVTDYYSNADTEMGKFDTKEDWEKEKEHQSKTVDNYFKMAEDEAKYRSMSSEDIMKEWEDKRSNYKSDDDRKYKEKLYALYNSLNGDGQEVEKDRIGKLYYGGTYIPGQSREMDETVQYVKDTYGFAPDEETDPNIAMPYTTSNQSLKYSTLYKDAKNREQFESIAKNNDALSLYNDIVKMEEDENTVQSLLWSNVPDTERGRKDFNDSPDHAMDIAERDTQLQYILEKYGVDLRNNYDEVEIGSNLLDDIFDKKTQYKSVLKGMGYDYDDMRYWEQSNKDKEKAKKRQESFEAFASDYPVAANIINLFTGTFTGGEFWGNALSGIPKVSPTGNREVENRTTFDDVTPDNIDSVSLGNNYNMPFTQFSNTVTSVTSQNIENTIKEALGDEWYTDLISTVASAGYGGVSSAIKSRLTASVAQAMFGSLGKHFVTGVTDFVLGSEAASSAMYSALDQGADYGDAFFNGLASGINEAAFETLSIEHYLNIGDYSFLNKNSIKELLKQGFAEGSEEFFTDIANAIANGIIMGDASELELSKQRYMAEGYSYEEALKKSQIDFLKQLLESAYGGFIGGTFGGAGKMALNTALSVADTGVNKIGEATQDLRARKPIGEMVSTSGNTENLIDIANSSENDKLMQLAEETSNAIANKNGESYSNSDLRKIGKLAVKTVNEVSKEAQSNAKDIDNKAIANALESVGVKPTAKTVAVISDTLEGKNTSKALNKLNISAEKVDGIFEKLDEDFKERTAKKNDILDKADTTIAKVQNLVFDGKAKNVSSNGETTLKSGKSVQIKRIASISNGNIEVELEDGTKVKGSDILYSSASESSLYNTIAKTVGINTEVANQIAKNYDPNGKIGARSYVLGMVEGVNLGKLGMTESNMQSYGRETFFSSLTDSQKAVAVKLGNIFAENTTNKNKTAIDSMAVESKGKQGQVILPTTNSTGVSTRSELIKKTRANASIRSIQKLVDIGAIKNNIYLYETEKNADGKYVLTEDTGIFKKGTVMGNGAFDTNTGDIYIDINSGANGESTIMYTLAHELTHFVKEFSPNDFDALATFVFDSYLGSGTNVNRLINKQREDYYRTHNKMQSIDAAYEEVVADTMQSMFTDGNLADKLIGLRNENPSLFDTISKYINKLQSAINKAYNSLPVQGKQDIESIKNKIDEMADIFAQAVTNAQNTYDKLSESQIKSLAETIRANKLEGAVDENGDSLFQIRALEADVPEYRQMLLDHGMSPTKVNALIKTVNEIVGRVKSNLEVLDYAYDEDINDRAFSPVKPNSDPLYKISVDFSTLCRKRILQQAVEAQLQTALQRALSVEEKKAIREELERIRDEGRQLELACRLCYVESARLKSPKQIQRFLNNKEKILKDYFANKSKSEIAEKKLEAELDTRQKLKDEHLEEINNGKYPDPMSYTTTAKGTKKYIPMKQLPQSWKNQISDAKRNAVDKYVPTADEGELINEIKNMGAEYFTTPEGLERLAKDEKYSRIFDAYTTYIRNATKSKGLESDVWWRAGDSDSITDDLISKMNKENGLRTQSWSDFQVIHLADYVSAIIELSTRNAKMHGYTKVPDYVKLMGKTNQMINMSLIPTQVYNGMLEYDPVEGMAIEKALELRRKYPETAGTICIGIDTNQIKQLLESSDIDYVIPYHKSGLSKVLRKMYNIPTWSDFENLQREDKLKGNEAKANADKYGVELLSASDPMWHKETKFSEWFDLKTAQDLCDKYNSMSTSDMSDSQKAAKKKYGVMFGGYMAMQDMANQYKKLCAERGLSPKFSKVKSGVDGNFVDEDNYWKLLIDRKMVNNKTGNIIEQKAVEPNFVRKDVMEILDDELARYPQVKADMDYATKEVVKKFLSGDLVGRVHELEKMSGNVQKAVDNLAVVNASYEDPFRDVALSDRDSDGNKLSEGQQEYFKDSKVRDKDGNLLLVYHGTKEDFSVFEKSKIGKNGAFEGTGFNFTPSRGRASSYGGKLLSGYLNITKPLSASRITMSVSKLADIIKKVDPTGDDIIANYARETRDYGKQSFVDREALTTARAVLNFSENDVDIYSELSAGAGGSVDLMQLFNDIGYDGVIHYDDDGNIKTAIAFNSNQFKLVDNLNPSTDKDIRFSDRDTDYLELAKDPKKNEKRLRELVDEAAKESFPNSILIQDGTFEKMWHFTNKDFDSFLPSISTSTGGLKGIFFTPNQFGQTSRLGNGKQYYLNVENLKFAIGLEADKKYVDMLKKRQKGITDRNELAEINRKFKEETGVDAFFDWQNGWYNIMTPEQIKSADLVTYDKKGEIIPLSKRFDKSVDDIKFSDREENFATGRKELAKKYNYSIPFNTEMEFVKQYQEGKANPENFFKNTMAVFNPIARRPKGTPDYVSRTRDGDVSSEYWYTPEGVIRGSKHWGSGIKTVDWQLGDNRYGRVVNGNKEYGFCAWDDFVYKTYVTDAKRDPSTGLLTDFSNARLTSFENPGVQFSDRDTDSLDTRTLLANALATTTQNEIEAKNIAEYQSKIQEMNAVQDELNKVRAELREQMFKKGGRKENFNDLKAKAQALANKINTYDKQLLRLESTQALKNVLEREKANAVKKAKAEYREMVANRKEKANNTEVRHKIKWLVDEFNRMQNHPTEKKYIPKSLIVPVNDLLMAVNLDSGRSEKLSEKLNTLYTQYSQLRNDPKNLMAYDETVADIIGKLATTIGNKSVYKMNSQELDLVYKALAGLMHVVKTSVKVRGIESNKNAYEISMKMKDETMSVEKTTNKFLKALKSPLKLINRSLRPETAFNRFGNYTKNSMWSKMYNVLNDGQTKQLRIQLEANSIFEDTFKKTKYLRSLTDTKNLVDVGLKDSNGNTVKITKGMALAIYKAMQNEDNMRHILRGGFTVPDLNAYYKGKVDAYGEGHINVRLVDSKKLTELRNELADINKQLEAKPDDLELLAQQGVIESEIDKEIGNGDQLGIEMFHKIQDMLTPDDEQFLDEVKYLFDEYLRGELNKTTMELYGFEKAHIDNYLPIHTDPNFRTAQFESIAKDMSLENSGFMKDRVNASNPIMLEDLSTMVSSQIDKVARYSGLSVPIKDFQKVFGKSEVNYNSSLQDALSSKFGNDAKKYIENLMADLVGGRMQETNIFDKLRGHMAGASLSVNPRVAFAQAASYPTAASEIGYKPLLKAMKMGLKSADRELIAKYSPLLWYRNENGRDVEMGDVAKMSRTSDKLMKKTQWLMGWINAMDTATVGRLWYASQYYVDDNFNLEKGTDDYYMKVAEVFNRVVEKTQPNYTTLQRPDILRSTNSITKQLTMFMTQRLQNFNIVYDATAQYMKYRHDASQGLNGVTKSDVKEARVGLARAVSSQVIAGLMITGIKFGVDLLLHSMNGYKDKDKQLTWDSIINQLIKNFGETMISNIIGGSEVNELANSLISGDTYYGVSVTAVESFTDLVKGFLNEASSIKTSIDINRIRDDLRAEVVATLGEEALADAEADTIQDEIGNLAKMLGYTKTELNDRYGVNVNSDPKVVEKTRKLAESLAQLFGLPLRNIDKIAEGLMAHIDDAANGMLFNYIGQSEEEEEQSAVFGDAMSKFNQGDVDGAVEIIKGIYQEKVDSGTEPSKAQSSVKSTMTNRLKPIYIKADASKRNEIRKLMYATGMYKSLDALDKVLAKWK